MNKICKYFIAKDEMHYERWSYVLDLEFLFLVYGYKV